MHVYKKTELYKNLHIYKKLYKTELTGKIEIAMAGYDSYFASYGKTDVEIELVMVDFSPSNKNFLFVDMPKTFIMIGELEEDLMYSYKRSYPYTKDNGGSWNPFQRPVSG